MIKGNKIRGLLKIGKFIKIYNTDNHTSENLT